MSWFESARRRRGFVVIILVIHLGLLGWALWSNSVTIDEVGHIPAGVSYWQTGRFSLYRVNPPLPRLLATLPVLLARPRVDHRHWTDAPGDRPEWEVGRDFAAANRANYMELVRLARLAGLLWSALGALVVYRWAGQLYGPGAACLGLVLWCFEPTILGHAPLATTDLPATVAGLAATFAFWLYLRRPALRGAVLAGALLGVAQLSKFTMLVLYGLWPLLAWVQLGRSTATDRRSGRIRAAAHAATILGVSLLVLNLGYGFTGTGRPLGSFRFVSRRLIGPEGDWGAARAADNRFAATGLAPLLVPVPADYLLGIDEQARDFEGRIASYLGGVWRNVGWGDFYLAALAVKWPLGLWGLVLWNGGATLSGRIPGLSRRDEWSLGLAFVVPFAFVSAQVGMSIHFRYALPAVPFALVSTAKLARLARDAGRTARAVLAVLIAGQLVSVLSVAPHWISYFNEAVGGPEHGDDHLIDSNIDWGQDLLHLRHWLDDHPEARPLHLACFQIIDPDLCGIRYDLPVPWPIERPATPAGGAWPGPAPGYYAISVNLLRGAIAPVPDGHGGVFQTPDRRSFAYFGGLQPIARAGYSIRIYHLDGRQADEIRRGWSLDRGDGRHR